MKRSAELAPEDLLERILGVLRIHCPALPEHTWQPLGQPLKQHLRRLGEEGGCRVWMGQTTGEYLWDVAWTHEADDSYWVELACEIELSDMNKEGALDDFYKVLDAKARLQVFIAATTQKMAKDLQGEIDWAVKCQRFRHPDERLIAALVSYSSRSNAYSAATCIFDGERRIGEWAAGWQDVSLGRPKE